MTGATKCPSGLTEEGCGFLLKSFYSTLFSVWKLVKYFLCVSHGRVVLFSFQVPWKGTMKIKLGIRRPFLHVLVQRVVQGKS